MRCDSFLSPFSRKAEAIRASGLNLDLMPHWIIFIICLLIFIGLFIFVPADSELRLEGLTIPGVCVFRNLTGIPCPGCGLTRSMVAAVHGDWARSFADHKLGLITLVYIVLQFIFHLGWVASPMIRARLKNWERHLNRGVIYLGVVFSVNWIFTLLLL